MKFCIASPAQLVALIFPFLPHQSLSHSRWKCPEPRSPSTGIKSGPCGGDTNNFDSNLESSLLPEIKPGPLLVTFEESIHHTGAPFRISLSGDSNDDANASCVLLDHIPHNDCCRPLLYDETTYTPYVITIIIPNVRCERCSLQLSNPMTDKIGGSGSPSGSGCTDPSGSCFSVYHSCTKPFRIVGNDDDGDGSSGNVAVPRSEYQCEDYQTLNQDWPTVWTGDDGETVDASVPGVYRRESSEWSDVDYTLTTAPAQYREDVGGLCGDMTSLSMTEPPLQSSMTPAPSPSLVNDTSTNENTDSVVVSPLPGEESLPLETNPSITTVEQINDDAGTSEEPNIPSMAGRLQLYTSWKHYNFIVGTISVVLLFHSI